MADLEISSGNKILDENVRNWLSWNVKGSKSYKDVEEMVKACKWKELEKIMVNRLGFGTAGLRGKMGPGFGQMNDLVIIQTTQGLAKYLMSDTDSTFSVKSMGAVIGYDARFNSARWAKLAAGVFLKLGFKVRLFSTITPTPFVPFTVVQKKACIGIMVTASHNPKEDNGYKVFWRNGPQILSPHDQNIQKHILDNLEPFDEDAFNEESIAYDGTALIDPLEDTSKDYYGTLKSMLFDEAMNRRYQGNIVYTAMHGVGANFVDKAFEVSGFQPVIHVKEQREPDPNFPTVTFPNPEEGKCALNLAQKTAVENSSIYILANDPDADRLAIAQRLKSQDWKIFNGNEIGALIGWWQFKLHTELLSKEVCRKNLHFIASTVSSKMLQSISNVEGVSFEETLTGFKWMANRAYEIEQNENENGRHKVMMAFEESIGYMCGTQVLDKDGVSGAIRAAELIAYLDEIDMTLMDKLNDIYTRYGYHCSRISYFLYDGAEVLNKIFGPLRNFGGAPNTYPSELAGKYHITDVRDLTTGYDSSRADKKALLPTDSKTQMITFKFSNGIVATLRTSGTEPKIKYYVEYCASKEQSNWQEIENQLDEFVEILVAEFLQPEIHGLTRGPSA